MSTTPPTGATNAVEMPRVAGFNTCRLCRQTFASPLSLFIDPTKATASSPSAQASLALMQHVMEKHPNVDAQIQTQAAQFLGMSRLMLFKMSDPSVEKQRDYLRWYVHQVTLNAQITDAKLAFKAEQLAMSVTDLTEANHFLGNDVPDHAEKTRATLRATIRDIIAATLIELRAELQEPGKYPNGPDTIVKAMDEAGIVTS